MSHPLLDAARTTRDEAIAAWVSASGGHSLCRPGAAPSLTALKQAEGAAMALRQLVRTLERAVSSEEDALDAARSAWRSRLADARGDAWHDYATGGCAALDALASRFTHRRSTSGVDHLGDA